MRIAHGNGHNKDSLVQFIKKAKADSASANEAHTLLDQLGQIPGTRLHAVRRDAKDPRARTTAIVTADKYEFLGEQTLRLGEAMPKVNDKLYPDRFSVTSYFAHPMATQLGFKGVAHRAIHPPPTVMKHDLGNPVVDSYRDYLNSTADYMRADRRSGFLLILTGDLQANAGYDKPWSPNAVLAKPLGLKARSEKIDWIMVDAALEFAGKLETHKLYDHVGIVATLRPA